jgi:hypothetical protein
MLIQRLLRKHLLDPRATAQPHASIIDRIHVLKHLQTRFMRSLTGRIDASAVDSVVDAAEVRDDLRSEGGDEGLGGDVSGDCEDVEGGVDGEDGGFGVVQSVLVQVCEGQFGAVAFNEGFGYCGANTYVSPSARGSRPQISFES